MNQISIFFKPSDLWYNLFIQRTLQDSYINKIFIQFFVCSTFLCVFFNRYHNKTNVHKVTEFYKLFQSILFDKIDIKLKAKYLQKLINSMAYS